MTEGTTPRDPRDEPQAAPQPPPAYRPADTPPVGEPPADGYDPQGYGQQGGWGAPGGQPQGSGIPENVASGLCYLATWVTGLIFYFIDRRPEVRFHAVQSIAFGVAFTVVELVLTVFLAALHLAFLSTLVWLAFVVIWIVLLVQGFQGRHFKLPIIGDFAEQQASRPIA
jgi:uncharacterized membrane protein